MNMYISKEVGNETKIQIIKILREQFNTISLSLKEAKDYIDSCIGEYNIFPKVVTQEKINELIRKLEPYNVSINTIKLMQQKYCTYTVRISINFVGLISYCVLYRIEIDLLGIQSVGIATLNQSQ